ncbi:hypothetical protein NC653_017803 [Populus alba x Populus x berolinensis]|uniref:Uncharacterized protein n=1 Tax=Populus alba x Populus x berolinensis TaxID=444605 RepID=A0AAD6W0Z4_9ROSI|nr:hypothetical protein NC653_017803 [Populus alba x Populus x berolinensis]
MEWLQAPPTYHKDLHPSPRRHRLSLEDYN